MDRGCDTNSMIERVTEVVILPKKNRKELYKMLNHLKRWRGVATRYAKNSASFLELDASLYGGN